MKAKSSPASITLDPASLAQVQLGARHTAMLDAARLECGGNAPWRHRKQAEALELCRLAEASGRMVIGQIDLRVEIRVDLLLQVTVACLPNPSEPPVVAEAARLGVTYREEAVVLPQPGFSFVQILAPQQVWSPSVSSGLVQALCLGTKLPAGIPLREIILMTYGALTMMSTQMDPANSAGVLNVAAAEWFQRNPSWIPLSNAPFLKPAEASV